MLGSQVRILLGARVPPGWSASAGVGMAVPASKQCPWVRRRVLFSRRGKVL